MTRGNDSGTEANTSSAIRPAQPRYSKDQRKKTACEPGVTSFMPGGLKVFAIPRSKEGERKKKWL